MKHVVLTRVQKAMASIKDRLADWRVCNEGAEARGGQPYCENERRLCLLFSKVNNFFVHFRRAIVLIELSPVNGLANQTCLLCRAEIYLNKQWSGYRLQSDFY